MVLERFHTLVHLFFNNLLLTLQYFSFVLFRMLLQKLWKSTVPLQITMLYFSPLWNKMNIYTWNYS